MNCVQRKCVYAFIGLIACLPGADVAAKDNNMPAAETQAAQFQWREHARLSWEDFKGEVNATHDESAPATCCSIGIKTNTPVAGGKTEVEVFNKFYTNKSWVRANARIQSILDHEQGHFDLCEVYTRKLKERIAACDLGNATVKQQLMVAYAEISREYESRQQAYEQETIHGTDQDAQRRWQATIAAELATLPPLVAALPAPIAGN